MGLFGIFLLGFLGVIFLSFGIASNIVYVYAPTPCGQSGSPPLPKWVFITGISYTIIGTLYVIAVIMIFLNENCSVQKTNCFKSNYCWQAIAHLCALFSIPWTMVGLTSWLRNGLDCASVNIPIWIMSIVNILCFIAIIPSVITIQVTMEHNRIKNEKAEGH